MKKKAVKIKQNIILVLHNHKTGKKKVIKGKNVVTHAGEVWYGQKACGETPPNNFTSMYLCIAGPNNPTKDDDYSDFTKSGGANAEKAKSTGYPKTNDSDGDNTGAGINVISWLFEWTTSDGPFTDITHCCISTAGNSDSEPILNSYKWDAVWSKDNSTSAKVFINHTISGGL